MDGELVKYYYLRDKQYLPVVTVCLLKRDGLYAGGVSKGIAICSVFDNPDKKSGRHAKRGYALHAPERS